MDGLDQVKICTAYRFQGKEIELPPYGAEAMARCEPVYEILDGWQQSTAGIRQFEDLPQNARTYLARMSELTGLPIDIISTGAERNDTIILNHPFG